jgi:hypothetical protein
VILSRTERHVNGCVRNVISKHTVGGVEVIGRSGDVLNRGNREVVVVGCRAAGRGGITGSRVSKEAAGLARRQRRRSVRKRLGGERKWGWV